MVWLIVLCGLGTFLLRWFPLWRTRQGGDASPKAQRLQRWLAGVGPAAISALMVASILATLGSGADAGRILIAAMALACVALVRWTCRGGVAIPTLSGALAYGLLSHLIG
ncbi:AzlD domain-containing protein [Stenotrophomonas sp. AB1(2024)]|uniref:AzlD domain-containing protein n=1 Tax=Stenotrophomonas sp. AB1(2024) TaxID=3132215 RepID=UPI0030AF1D1C